MPRVPRALIALTALAAALRLPTLGSQSLWLDEVLTGNLAARDPRRPLPHRRPAGGQPAALLPRRVGVDPGGGDERVRAAAAVGAVRDRARAGGVGDRPAAGRRAHGGRAGGARGGAPAARLLLAGGARLRGGRARVRARVPVLASTADGRRSAFWWALASAVALGCHYFAIFPVAIEAAILLARRRERRCPRSAASRRRARRCCRCSPSSSAATTATTSPAGVGLATRVKGVATSWIVGERGAAINKLEWLGGALLMAPWRCCCARSARRRGAVARRRRRRRGRADAAHRARRRRLHQQPQHDRRCWRSCSPPRARVRGRAGRGGALGAARCVVLAAPRRSAR